MSENTIVDTEASGMMNTNVELPRSRQGEAETNSDTEGRALLPDALSSDTGAIRQVNTNPGPPRSSRQGIIKGAQTSEAVPPADTHSSDPATATLPGREAIDGVNTKRALPPVNPTPSSATAKPSRTRRQARAVADPQPINLPAAGNLLSADAADPVSGTCVHLNLLQRVRVQCIKTQGRLDKAMEAALATALGMTKATTPELAKTLYAQAHAIRVAVEAGKLYAKPFPSDDPRADMLRIYEPMILISAKSRAAWDDYRAKAETEMRKLAETLPVWPWAKSVKGLGALGLARIVGEAPLIGRLATPERLWKRLGLAVIEGERQQRKGDVLLASIHGYSPRRRAEVWSIADIMFRHQWRRAPDDAGKGALGGPIGPYGDVYRRRREHTEPRVAATANEPVAKKWTLGRCHNDALRVMSKELLRDLWREWHGLDARQPRRWSNGGE